MLGKGKRFVSKKNSITYRLVQKQGLDQDGSDLEHVLLPVSDEDHEKYNIKLPAWTSSPPENSQLEQIPAKGPHPDWDPDTIAALDDFYPEDAASVLEDDFIARANGCVGESQPYHYSDLSRLPYEELKGKTLLFAETEDEESVDEEEGTEQPPKYDCQSIINTYSNTKNHPAVIKMEKKKVKIPAVLWKKEESVHFVSTSCHRQKEENQDEKRLRKQAVKLLRRESRMAKKENELMFKEEKEKTKSVVLNARRTGHTLLL